MRTFSGFYISSDTYNCDKVKGFCWLLLNLTQEREGGLCDQKKGRGPPLMRHQAGARSSSSPCSRRTRRRWSAPRPGPTVPRPPPPHKRNPPQNNSSLSPILFLFQKPSPPLIVPKSDSLGGGGCFFFAPVGLIWLQSASARSSDLSPPQVRHFPSVFKNIYPIDRLPPLSSNSSYLSHSLPFFSSVTKSNGATLGENSARRLDTHRRPNRHSSIEPIAPHSIECPRPFFVAVPKKAYIMPHK